MHSFYNNSKFWQFSPIPNIEESNFDRTLERFYNLRIPGLVRENIQNSLDGKLLDSDEPVLVTIKTGTIKTSNIPGINEVIERIQCLKGRNTYTKETIMHMLSKVNQEEVKYISFEDENTRGLTGAKNGQKGSATDTWAIYAYNKGVHSEEEDQSVETSRGGSHGVGKIASNAASDIHVMYFANCDAEGNQHLGGTVQLIEHEYENKCYRSTGYFTDRVDHGDNQFTFYPFENQFHEVFEKKTRGLKIVIPFLREEYDDETEIIKSVCDSFFIAILNKKLIVKVNDKKITNETILDFIKNENYYIQNIGDMKKEFTPLYVDTYLNVKERPLQVSDGLNQYHFQLFFRYDEQIPKGRVAIIRTIGMKIEDFKITGNANKPYNAVLIGGPIEDAYLKSLENESHTQLSYQHIKDPKLQKHAKKFINTLGREIAKVIDEAIKQHNQPDGPINTGDILYVIENQFKKDLNNAMGTVTISKGKSLVKSTTDIQTRKKRKPKTEDGSRIKVKNPDPIRRKKRQPIPDDSEENNKPRMKYSVHPSIVERLIVGNHEIVKFNFNKSDVFANEKSCDIFLSMIDGMGIEYTDEFNIDNNYSKVIDLASKKEYKYEKNKIKNVQIQNGIAQLRLELKNHSNKALKFIYHVEV